VNAVGRRWAVLTNGKAWHFYDNQVPKPAAEKLELTIELKDARATDTSNVCFRAQCGWQMARSEV
jgi:hypothetical protein